MRHDLGVTSRCKRHAALLEAFFEERDRVILGIPRLRKRDPHFDRAFSKAEQRMQADGVPPMFTLRPALRDLARGGEAQELVAPMIAAADRANGAVTAYVDRSSWVSPMEVGWSGSFAAAALVVHADDVPDVQRKAIERMREGVATGTVDPRRLAHLVDRVEATHGRNQIYGTLLVPSDGRPQNVWPMGPESVVDEARSTIGLPRLGDDRDCYEHGAQLGPFLIPSTREDSIVLNTRLAVSYMRHGRLTRRCFGSA
jgi:Family of unknown function (DUF6624)